MKTLWISLSTGAAAVLHDLGQALTARGVNITQMSRNSLNYTPSSFMRDDVDYLVAHYAYTWAQFTNITFPTTKLSATGHDEEYYLTTVQAEVTYTVVINTTKGNITVLPTTSR